MPRKKLIRFLENQQRKNLIEPGKEFFGKLKGKWNELYFSNKGEIVLELGCGKAEYTTQLALKEPARNFIGVDVKGARLWFGSNYSEKLTILNTAFLRCPIYKLDEHFGKDEVTEIWIPFPDPFPLKEGRRLISFFYIKKYLNILRKSGIIHFKTDDSILFEYSLNSFTECGFKAIKHSYDIHNSDISGPAREIITNYENYFIKKNRKICYGMFGI